MNWITPPECQGRIVEVSYALRGDKVLRRHFDRSDRSTCFFSSTVLTDDQCEWWNGEPRNKRWRRLSRREIGRLGLDDSNRDEG